MKFSLGCAVWAYKGWVGDLYPPKTASSQFLGLYSQRFTAVEGNTTFYVVPDAETVARWAAETADGFEFCLKLPRSLTHVGLLTPSIPGALQFLERVSALGSRLGPIFAQLPSSYGPELLADLKTFLSAWPRDRASLALEVRHLDWFCEPFASRLTNLLEQLGIGRVLLDTRPIYDCPDDPQIYSERRKPKLPLEPSITADFGIVRFVSHPKQAFNQSYLEAWVPYIDRWLNQGSRVYFFVHCPIEERSPHNARYFQQILENHDVSVPFLPWDRIVQPSTQLDLF